MAAKNSQRRYMSDFHVVSYNSPGTPIVYDRDPFYAMFGSSRVAGTTMPSYRTLIKRHESATSILSGELAIVDRKEHSMKKEISFQNYITKVWTPCVDTFRGYTPALFVYTYPPVATIDPKKATTLASKKFYQKVSYLNKSFDGFVWLGELRETVRMLRNPAKAMFDFAKGDYLHKVNQLHNRYFGTRRNTSSRAGAAKDFGRALRSTWLEYSYGVRPLASDIENAIDACERLVQEPIVHKIINSVGVDGFEGITYLRDTTLSGQFRFGINRRSGNWVKVRYKGLYRREVDRPTPMLNMDSLNYTKGLFGLTMDQFIPSVWELMPWSFLADYFFNIGDILEQSFTSFADVRWVKETTITDSYIYDKMVNDMDHYRTYYTSSPRLDGLTTFRQGYCNTTRRSFYRRPKTPDVNPLTFHLPGKHQQWLNMGALWSQANDISPQKHRIRGR